MNKQIKETLKPCIHKSVCEEFGNNTCASDCYLYLAEKTRIRSKKNNARNRLRIEK